MEPEQALKAWRTSGQPALDPQLLLGFALPLLQHLVALRSQDSARLPLLALNGPVGAGKTSLGRALEALAPSLGLRLRVASIDDLYLPWPQRQRRLAGNPFAVSRVPPGSHDLELLLEALGNWRQSGTLRLPRFDKTLAQGQGDRSGWRQGPCDALVLEGWLMGCRALGPEGLATALHALDPDRPGFGGAPALTTSELAWLPTWDRQLEAYEPLWEACDGLWVLRPLSWELPRRWRFQAEARQRRHGGGWLPPAALEQLVRSSLCSLPPSLYQDPLVADPLLVLQPELVREPAMATVDMVPGDPAASVRLAPDLRDQELTVLTAIALDFNGSPRPAADFSIPQRWTSAAGATTWLSLATGSLAALEATAKTPSGVPTPRAETATSPMPSETSPHQHSQASAVQVPVEGLNVEGVAVLDGRRRCRGLWRRQRQTQASPSDSSSLMG